jgi:hypothetical protein
LAAPACFALAAILLGHALQIADGFYHPAALSWLTAALLLTLAGACMVKAEGARSAVADRALRAILCAGIVWQLISLFATAPAAYLRTRDLFTFRCGLAAEALCITVGVLPLRRLQRFWFPALLAVQFALGVWILHWSPSPPIDVVTVHHAAISALLHGRNPYAITFENIYGDQPFYNPSLLAGHHAAFGYPYPPLSLLVAVPAQVLTGDYRYAELVAIVAAAWFVGYSQRGGVPKLAAALLLTTPRIYFVLEQGWTEPIAIALLAMTALCLARKPGWVPWAAGLLTVTKQYLIVAVPLLLRLGWQRGREAFRFFAYAACAGCVVTLPFVFWRFRPFLADVVLLQFREPIRSDSLSYASWSIRAGFGAGSMYWPIAAAAIGIFVGLLATPNTPAGFLASLSLATFTMFAFGSKAFCNYYVFIIAALCCTIALGDAARERPL